MTENVKYSSQLARALPRVSDNGLLPIGQLPDGALLIVDADLRIVLADGPGLVYDAAARGDLRGRRLDEAIAVPVLEVLVAHLQAALAGEERTVELASAGGGTSRLTIVPRRDTAGRVDGALIFCWDPAAGSARAAAAESELRYRLLAESATDVVSLRDGAGVCHYISPSITALTGYRPEELIGHDFLVIVDAADRQRVAARMEQLFAGEDLIEMQYRIRRRDGSLVWVRTAARALRDPSTGSVTEIRTSTHDVTEQWMRETELQATTAELKLRLRETAAIAQLGEHALEEPDLDHFLTDATAKVAEILRVPMCAVLVDDRELRGGLRMRAGTGWRPGTIGRLIAPRGAADDRLLAGRGEEGVAFTDLPSDTPWCTIAQEHGAVSGMWVVVADRDEPYGVLAVHTHARRTFTDDDRTFLIAVANILRDAIARHRAEDAARHDALHDALTGLANRRLLTDRLGHALTLSARSGARHAVMFMDIDRFKLVNDSLGHDAGDRLLQLLGPHLRAAVHRGDTVARFGGDEFVVLCEDVVDERNAARIARRLTDAVHRPFDLDGREHVASASVGVAVTSGAGCTPEEVLRDADTAMYRAKEAGGGRFELFDAGMRQRTLARLELEDDLRRALARDELVVHYQPIHAIDTAAPAVVEALVRWQHPQRGLLAPGEFISIAEETNLIVPLGAQVLRQACAQVAGWRAALPVARELSLAVNVSARQIAQPGFIANVSNTLTQTGLPAPALCLEITEGVLLRDSDATAHTISALRALGIRIVLDDFGTGYSSLSYLRRFSLDVLKIDRSFVAGLDQGLEDHVIVEAIVTMAHALGLDVMAEGVETPEQLEALRELGSGYVQGYLLARPMPAEGIEQLLRGQVHSY